MKVILWSFVLCLGYTTFVQAQQVHTLSGNEVAPDTVINDGKHVLFTGTVYGFKEGELFINLRENKLVALKIRDGRFRVSIPMDRGSQEVGLYYLAKNRFIPFRIDSSELVGAIYKSGFTKKSTIYRKMNSESVIIRHEKEIYTRLLQKGATAPDFQAITSVGQSFHLADAVKEKYILLNFTAIACEGCWMAYPELEKMQEQYGDLLQIVTLYGGKTTDRALWEKLAAEKPFHKNWLDIWGIDKKISDAYPLKGFPMFFLIDREGKIADTWFGYRPKYLEKVLRNLSF